MDAITFAKLEKLFQVMPSMHQMKLSPLCRSQRTPNRMVEQLYMAPEADFTLRDARRGKWAECVLISVYLLAQAVLLWQLASWAKVDPEKTRPAIAVFFATTVLTIVLSWMFFVVPPLVNSAVIAAFLGLALVPRRE